MYMYICMHACTHTYIDTQADVIGLAMSAAKAAALREQAINDKTPSQHGSCDAVEVNPGEWARTATGGGRSVTAGMLSTKHAQTRTAPKESGGLFGRSASQGSRGASVRSAGVIVRVDATRMSKVLTRTASDPQAGEHGKERASAPRNPVSLRLRAPGRVRDRPGAGATVACAPVQQGANTAVLAHEPPRAVSSPSSCSSPDGEAAAEEQAAPVNLIISPAHLCQGAQMPCSSAQRTNAVEGISPATRRYGGMCASSDGAVMSWFPITLGSPFQPDDKRGRLSLNLCYSKSSKAVLTLLATALGWANRELNSAPSSIYWAVSPEEVEEMLILHKPNQRVARLPGMHDLCRKVPVAIITSHT